MKNGKKHTNQCQANHEGSSGKMEVDAVIEMFECSETLHIIKYANCLGNGDSKTFNGIMEKNLYENKVQKNLLIMYRREWALD